MSNINYEADRFSEALYNGGAAYVGLLDTADKVVGGFRPFGYCSALEIQASDTKEQLRSSISGPSVVAEEVTSQRDVTLTMTIENLSPENAALGLHGELSSTVKESGRVEVKEGFLGRPTPLDYSIDFSAGATAPVITNEDGTVTYVEGTHYVLNQGSVYWLIEQPVVDPFVDGDNFEITYDTNASKTVEAFVKSTINVQIYIEAFNQSRDNAPNKYWIYKVSIDPSSAYSVLNTDGFTTLEITGTVLESKAVQGSGVSKMFKQVNYDLQNN